MDISKLLPVLGHTGQDSDNPPPGQPTNLPFYLSERNFRRYEQTIQLITETFPSTLNLDPVPLSPLTFTCRLRDAIVSVLKYKWTTTINLETLAQIKPNLKITSDENEVTISPRHKRGLNPVKPPTIVKQSLPPECLEAFALLLHHRLIEPVTVCETPETLVALKEKYDITYEQSNTGYTTIY